MPIPIPYSSIWTFLTWLPSWILKRKFPKELLAELIEFDILPRHQSVTLNLGIPADLRIFAYVANRSLFTVELDRASIKFYCCGMEVPLQILSRTEIKSGQKAEVFLSCNIGKEQADFISANINNHQSRIEAVVDFNCDLHNFKKERFNLSGIIPEFVNTHLRSH